MKIIYTFPDNYLQYDCTVCNGLCCNLNATLIFNNEQISKIENIKYLREYMEYGKESTKLVCGKKCWFIKNNRCSLSEDTKPLGCKLYPLNLWKLDEIHIIVDVIPCPQMHISINNGMKYHDNEDYINKFVHENKVQSGKFQEKIVVSNQRNIDHKIQLYEKWKTHFFNLKNELMDPVIHMLFAQIPISPVIFNIQQINYDDIYQFYSELYLEMKKNNFCDNLYSLFIALRNSTIKHVLYKYYFPYNKTILQQMELKDQLLYKALYEKQNNSSYEQERIFDLFYFHKESMWRLLE